MNYAYDERSGRWLPEKQPSFSARPFVILIDRGEKHAYCASCRAWEKFTRAGAFVRFACGKVSKGVLLHDGFAAVSRISIRHDPRLHETFLALDVTSARLIGLLVVQQHGFRHWHFNMQTGQIKYEYSEQIASLQVQLAPEICLILQRLFTCEAAVLFGTAYKNTISQACLKSIMAFITCPTCPALAYIKDFLGPVFKTVFRRNDANVYKRLCDAIHVRLPKKVKKLFSREPHVFATYIILKACGFTDENAIQLFFAEKEVYLRYFSDISLDSSVFLKSAPPALSDLREHAHRSHARMEVYNGPLLLCAFADWIRQSCAETSEIVTARRLLKCMKGLDKDEIEDTIYMMHDLQAILTPQIREVVRKNGYCHEAHELLIDLNNELYKRCRVNTVIPYTETERALIGPESNLLFELPVDTNSLVDIGSTMHICVGSYQMRVLRHDCIIVTASDVKSGKLVACLELQKNAVTQAKGYCNHHLEKAVLYTISAWMQRHHLLARSNDLNPDEC